MRSLSLPALKLITTTLGRAATEPSCATGRVGMIRTACLAAALCMAPLVAAADPAPSDWCDTILPLSAIAEAVPQDTSMLTRRASGVVSEGAGRCSRIYSIGGNRFSDELIVLVTPARDAAAARADIGRIAREAEAEGYFGLTRPEGIGDSAVSFIRPDPLSRGYRVEFNVSFAVADRVVELKYQSVDDGEDNKFIQSRDEVVAIAAGVAERSAR